VVVPAILLALVLGVQPLLGRRPDGTPLFFPFGLEVTLPAVVIPHLLIGIAEAVLALAIWRHAKRQEMARHDTRPRWLLAYATGRGGDHLRPCPGSRSPDCWRLP
jgi:hypothetical protein